MRVDAVHFSPSKTPKSFSCLCLVVRYVRRSQGAISGADKSLCQWWIKLPGLTLMCRVEFLVKSHWLRPHSLQSWWLCAPELLRVISAAVTDAQPHQGSSWILSHLGTRCQNKCNPQKEECFRMQRRLLLGCYAVTTNTFSAAWCSAKLRGHACSPKDDRSSLSVFMGFEILLEIMIKQTIVPGWLLNFDY